MIHRCKDYRRIKKLIFWEPVFISDKIIYLVETQDGKDLGVWSLHKYLDGYMIHADMGQDCRGKRGKNSMLSAFKWMFDNMAIANIYAKVNRSHKAAQRMATMAGMVFTHSNNDNRFFQVKKCHS